MRAVWLREFGGPEVLIAGDAPDPVAGPRQALIDVAFAIITFVETQVRASGAGTLLVQLARAAGARVVAAAGGARKVELARELGADVAVDYREPGWTERVREAVGGVDVVFDGVGGAIGRSAFELLDRGGRMLSFGLASGEWAGISDEMAADRGVTVVRGSRPTPEELRRPPRARSPRRRLAGCVR